MRDKFIMGLIIGAIVVLFFPPLNPESRINLSLLSPDKNESMYYFNLKYIFSYRNF